MREQSGLVHGAIGLPQKLIKVRKAHGLSGHRVNVYVHHVACRLLGLGCRISCIHGMQACQ